VRRDTVPIAAWTMRIAKIGARLDSEPEHLFVLRGADQSP
jgi:hypothetical protein